VEGFPFTLCQTTLPHFKQGLAHHEFHTTAVVLALLPFMEVTQAEINLCEMATLTVATKTSAWATTMGATAVMVEVGPVAALAGALGSSLVRGGFKQPMALFMWDLTPI
jgi:hypothetical protein